MNLDFRGVFLILFLLAAFAGWLVIEALIWLFSNISISWAG